MAYTENQQGNKGLLILVGTPIGNLSDITYRAVETLKSADILLCEDTRRTGMLLMQLKIEREGPTLSFHDHSGPKMFEKIKTWFREGKTIAYVTDGGMPSVADPGFVLVRRARHMNVPVTTVPGPTAVAAFFAVCGLESPKFFFHGFFPRTKGEIEKVIQQIRELNVVHVFYESPNRVLETLEVLDRNVAQNAMALGRELTKLHEEILTGTAGEIGRNLAERDRVRGECVFGVLGGNPALEAEKEAREKQRLSEKSSQVTDDPYAMPEPKEDIELTPEQHQILVAQLQSGRSAKDIAKEYSKVFGISRRAIYDYVVRRLT